MEILSISEARKNLSSIVSSLADKTTPPVCIQVRGHDAAVLLSTQEYEQMRKDLLEKEFDEFFEEFAELNRELAAR